MSFDRENREVLSLVQALIGAVSPNFRRVSLELIGTKGTRIRFLLESDDARDREEIDDIVAEFGALAWGHGHGELYVDTTCDARPLRELHFPGRVVYGRKE